MTTRTASTEHFSAHATLAALGLQIRSLRLFAPIEKNVRIFHKSIKHQPIEKLSDAFIAILAGAHGLSEINTRLRADLALQRACGRKDCAEQSVVQRTLDACPAENVGGMRRAFTSIFRTHRRAYRHQYNSRLQLLDVDITGLPCGSQAALSKKGYFSKAGIRYGRQLGRVLATHYEEIVVDHLSVPVTSNLAERVMNSSSRSQTVPVNIRLRKILELNSMVG